MRWLAPDDDPREGPSPAVGGGGAGEADDRDHAIAHQCAAGWIGGLRVWSGLDIGFRDLRRPIFLCHLARQVVTSDRFVHLRRLARRAFPGRRHPERAGA